jgi:hypothetical protein
MKLSHANLPEKPVEKTFHHSVPLYTIPELFLQIRQHTKMIHHEPHKKHENKRIKKIK